MRILLVEDDPDLAQALKFALEDAGYGVDLTLDGEEAKFLLSQDPIPYSLGIFDWMLPGISGIDLCRQLRANRIPLPVLMLTAKDQMLDKVAGLDAGSDDYLIKPFDLPELLARIRALLRRPLEIQSRQWQVGDLTLNYDTYSVHHHNQITSLTPKEFQLLECFMQHPNQILSSDRIRSRLWEFGESPASNIVAAQVRLLRRKLGSGAEAVIETVFGVGYRFNVRRDC